MSLSKSERCSRVIMLTLGISCVISGVYYISQSFTDTRAMLISDYSAAIRTFSSDHFAFFSNLDIDVICDGRSPERLVKRKEEVNGICRNSKCDVHSDIPSYLSVVHVLANISHDMVRCQLALTPATVPAPPLQSLLPFPDAPLKKQVVLYLNAKMCHNRGGSFHNDGYCYVPGWLKSGCATVSGASIGNVSLGGVVPSGYSCDIISAFKASDVWDYAQFNPPSAAPSLMLRSFKDPYMIAQVITGGTLDFGSTPKDNYNAGVVLLSLGCALFLPQICLCAFQMRSWLQERHRRRYHANLDRAAEVDSPSDSPVNVGSGNGGSRRQISQTGRKRHDLQSAHLPSGGGTIVELSPMTRRLSPRPKATIVDMSTSASNV
jgi:hypothetical protein